MLPRFTTCNNLNVDHTTLTVFVTIVCFIESHNLLVFLTTICHERSRLNLRKESFPNRAVNMWNFLPEHVVNAPSVDSFKNRLEKQWINEEIVYDYKAATPAGRNIFAPAGTQYLTIEAKACGHEAT